MIRNTVQISGPLLRHEVMWTMLEQFPKSRLGLLSKVATLSLPNITISPYSLKFVSKRFFIFIDFFSWRFNLEILHRNIFQNLFCNIFRYPIEIPSEIHSEICLEICSEIQSKICLEIMPEISLEISSGISSKIR